MKNLTVILNIGIPASGKSTWSKEFIKKNPNYIRVSRDDYRLMLKDQQMCEPKIENLITRLSDNAILSALSAKCNVIVDNTNLKIKYLNHYIKLLKHKADIEFKIFDISLNKAIERDNNRTIKVGEKVIRDMYSSYLNLFDSNFDFSNIKRVPIIYKNRIENGLPKAICIDLDGTIAHMNNKRSPFEWDKCHLDDVDTVVLEHVKLYKERGYIILFFTARDAAAVNSTTKWLEMHNIPYDELITKGLNDNRKDLVVKKEMLETLVLPRYDVILLLDDKDSVVEMYRDMGLKSFQVESYLS